ncbi:MAG: helix-turn-helix domain-containing protein [bacterium]
MTRNRNIYPFGTDSLQAAIKDLETSCFGAGREGVYRLVIEMTERILIEHILVKTGGNKLQAAKILGINRNTLHSKIKKLGITEQ